MNKEEACAVLDDMKVKIDIPKSAVTQHKRNEALDMAISALSTDGEYIKKSELFDKTVRRNSIWNEVTDSEGKGLEEIVNGLPTYSFPDSAENKGEWIPVSERLPEKFRFVNCTCHSLIDDREDWVVETVYVPQPSISPYSDWGNIPMLNDRECEVIAWMYREIPEPYKKGE